MEDNKVIRFPTNGMFRRPAVSQIADVPFEEEVDPVRTHAAEPIKEIGDIIRISQYLIDNRRYRDNLLFIAGINFGLRCGDLLRLKVGHLITEDGSAYRQEIVLREEKTGKVRRVYINEAVMDAADLYFRNQGTSINLNQYLFRGSSNRCSQNKPMAVYSAERVLKEVVNDKLNICIKASTHCLRKTFGYHVVMGAKDRARAVEFLQKIFGHSSSAVTLRYIGITDDEIKEAYQNLNLGKIDPVTSCGLKEAV